MAASSACPKEDAQRFDYEAELVIAIGQTARNVSEADAPNVDLRLRHRQRLHGARPAVALEPVDAGQDPRRVGSGRTLVGHGGPCGRRQPQDRLRVNGEVRQTSNTSDMVFNCKQLVELISRYFTLKPGDLIFTGTPEGVISGYPKDKQVWLKAGDKLTTSIEKLGDLEFKLT